MAGNTFDVNADLHTSALSAVNTAVCRLCGYDKFRTDLVFIDDVLPAQTVAVLFLNGSHDHDLASFRDQVQIFHDPCAVDCRYQSAALVGYTASADFCVVLVSLVRIEVPVVDVSDAYCVDMCIVCYDFIACSHVSDDISLRIDNDLVEVQFLHFGSNCVDVCFLIAALARILYDSAEKCGHVFLITLCSFFDFVEVHSFNLLSLFAPCNARHSSTPLRCFVNVIVHQVPECLSVVPAPDDGFVSLGIRVAFGGEEEYF